MKSRNRRRIFALLAVMALVMVACGGDDDPAATTAAPSTTEAPGAAPPAITEAPGTTAAPDTTAVPDSTEVPSSTEAPEGMESENLTLWVYDDGRIEILSELGEEFAEEYGVDLTIEAVDLTELRQQMQLGSGPDLAIIPHDNLGALVESGAVVPLDLGDKEGEYLPNSIDGFTYNGELHGLPLAVENLGFFYNTDMVAEPPATWDEVREVGAALVESGDAESAIGLPDLTYNSYPVFTSFGGYIFGRDDAGNFVADDLGIANEGMVEGLTWIGDLAADGLIPQNVDWDAAHVLFETGRQPFILTGPWAVNRFQEAGVPYAVTTFPAASDGGDAGYPFLGVQGIVVNAASPKLLLAQTFALEKIATEDSMLRIYEAEPRPSAWTSVFELATDPDAQGFNAAGVAAVPMPSIPAMGFVWDAWVNAGTLVMTGELEPAEALAQAEEQIQGQIEDGG